MQCIPRNMLCLDLCAAVQFASETHPFRNHSPSLKVKRNSVYLSVSMGLKKKSIFPLRHSIESPWCTFVFSGVN